MFKKRGALKRVFLPILLSLFCLSIIFLAYVVFAQESPTHLGSVTFVEISKDQADYEGYLLLDKDDDVTVSEEDISLLLEEINSQVSDANTHLLYLQSTYGFTVTLTQITISTSIKNSASQSELQKYLPQLRQELEQLAEQINALQNAIGDLDQKDPNITPVKQYFDALDEDIYYALWYTGRG